MTSVAAHQLMSRLDEYLRRVKAGERIQVTSQGEVMAELRPPESAVDGDVPEGLLQLGVEGTARNIVRNKRDLYEARAKSLDGVSSGQLLEWDRGER